MEFIEQKIKGVWEIRLNPFSDHRGFFMRAYDVDLFKEAGLHRDWVQENHSRSQQMGIIRGLHFQKTPFSETKLVRCILGAILDVVVDIRENSPTFGEWVGVELTEDNKKLLYIPRGFAHGFCTLTDISEVVYKVDNFYSKENEVGILWNDMDIGIQWPTQDPILSEKDKGNVTINEFLKGH